MHTLRTPCTEPSKAGWQPKTLQKSSGVMTMDNVCSLQMTVWKWESGFQQESLKMGMSAAMAHNVAKMWRSHEEKSFEPLKNQEVTIEK